MTKTYKKTPIEHAFGVEPMLLEDLPGLVFKRFDDIVTHAKLHPEYIRPFFDMVVENCARIAEAQANTFDGSKNEGAGCKSAAFAIRLFGKNE
jgi:hypothetical protein